MCGGGNLLIYRYLIPYLFFQLFIGSIIGVGIVLYDHLNPVEFIHRVEYEIWMHIGSMTVFMDQLWFLGILAISLPITLFLLRLFHYQSFLSHYWYDAIILLALSSFAILCASIESPIPLRLKTVPCIVAIIYAGNRLHCIIEDIVCRMGVKHAIILSLVFILFALNNKTVNTSLPVYNNFMLFAMTALLGITITFYLSHRLGNKFMAFVGRNSLIIFSIHWVWLRIYAFLISWIMCADYRIMSSLPLWACILGPIFVLPMSICSYYLIRGIYGRYYNFCKCVLKF